MPNRNSGASKARDNRTRKSVRLQRQLEDERTRLAALTGLIDSELQWIDDFFMNYQIHGRNQRMLALTRRAEIAYRDEDLNPLVSLLAILLREDGPNRRTRFYEVGKPILDKLKKLP